MGLFGSHARVGASAVSSAYEIEGSLKFMEADSTYLSRTPSGASNLNTWTVSFWMKLAKTGVQHMAFTTGANGSNRVQFAVENSHKINLECTSGGSNQLNLISDHHFKDTNSWYHFLVKVDTTQGTASNRGMIYVNGVKLTSFSTEVYPSEDADLQWNKAAEHNIGKRTYSSNYMDGYLAEFYSIDGTALGPESFGKTDADTGQWVPIEYSGSYGTNGFYLKWLDNSGTTATTLGKDSSGNGNNWTPNGFNTGAAVKDSPTNNFATLFMQRTPYESGATITNGMLHFNSGTGTSARNMNKTSMSNYLVNSGKWYAEFWFTTASAGNMVGVCPYEDEAGSGTTNGAIYGTRFGNGNKYIGDGVVSYPNNYWDHGSSYGDGDVIMVMLDMDSSPPRMYTGKNGQWADGSGNDDEAAPNDYLTLGNNFLTTNASMAGYLGFLVVSGGAASNCQAVCNFGQDSTFSGKTTAGGNTDSEGYGNFKYTVPTGAKCMCSKNIPTPTIKKSSDYFNTVLYTGNGSTQSITGVGFQPNWIWVKKRNSSSNHFLVDSVTGVNKELNTNQRNAQAANTNGITAIGSDGFSVGTDGGVNGNTDTFVAWNWKESATAGYDLVSYEGNTTAGRTVAHNLGVKPDMIIVKNIDDGNQEWGVYNSGLGATRVMFLDDDSAGLTNSIFWNNTEPTSSVFTVGTASTTNEDTLIAHVFASVAGYSKFGKYIGNGNVDGMFVYTGFKPAYVLVKRTNSGSSYWDQHDNKRNTLNVVNTVLYPNATDDEESYAVGTAGSPNINFLANGFKLESTHGEVNGSGDTYLYAAWAERSFKYANAR